MNPGNLRMQSRDNTSSAIPYVETPVERRARRAQPGAASLQRIPIAQAAEVDDKSRRGNPVLMDGETVEV